jgi:regulator of PEP synthase PpsR (kinase-PPPase family)
LTSPFVFLYICAFLQQHEAEIMAKDKAGYFRYIAVRPAVHQQVRKLAVAQDIQMYEVVAAAIDLYKASLKQKVKP